MPKQQKKPLPKLPDTSKQVAKREYTMPKELEEVSDSTTPSDIATIKQEKLPVAEEDEVSYEKKESEHSLFGQGLKTFFKPSLVKILLLVGVLIIAVIASLYGFAIGAGTCYVKTTVLLGNSNPTPHEQFLCLCSYILMSTFTMPAIPQALSHVFNTLPAIFGVIGLIHGPIIYYSYACILYALFKGEKRQRLFATVLLLLILIYLFFLAGVPQLHA